MPARCAGSPSDARFVSILIGVALVGCQIGGQETKQPKAPPKDPRVATTELWSAVVLGDSALVAQAITDGANPNISDTSGVTALMVAAGRGHSGTIRALLGAGADKEARTSDAKVTALTFAADLGNLGAVQSLVEGGASLQATDKHGYSPLDYVVIPNTGDSPVDPQRTIDIGKYLKEKGGGVKKGVGSTAGNLLAVLYQPDLRPLLAAAAAFRP